MNMCKTGEFHFTKFTSNNKELLLSIPKSQRRIGVKDQDLSGQPSNEKPLGICFKKWRWCILLKTKLEERPLTKRVLLLVVSSIYDSLGFAASFVLEERILQSLCEENVQWDTKVCNDVQQIWNKWKRKLKHIEQLYMQRCIKPVDFGEVLSVSLHNFADTCKHRYGQCSYIRLVSKEGKIHHCLLLGKAKPIPKNSASVARLELIAGTLSVKVASVFKKKLDLDEIEERFWMDSKVVLGYVTNDLWWFKTFVTNRMQQKR